MKHRNSKLCGQNAEFQYAKAGGIYSDHWTSFKLLDNLEN